MTTLADRYALEEELGRGGMGVVYRARERASGREVAVKLLLPGAHHAPELLLRLRREAEVLAALRHPGIATVHAAGEDGGRPWLAMELIPGARPLDRAWVGLDRAARVRLVRDVARALGHAHARGVVHRDVKAANVLVGADGAPRLVDFGLALPRGAEPLTATGTLLGTPYAMAPEQLEGARDALGPATDVWALGVLLFEGATPVALGMRVLSGPPPAPSALDPTVPAALDGVVLRALRRSPAERFGDGEAFAAALEEAARSQAPRGGAPRGLALALALALALIAAGAAGAAGLARTWPAPGPLPPSTLPGPTPPSPATPSPPDADGAAEERALRARPREERGAAARAWLARFPRSPLAPRVRRLALAEPLAVIRTRRPGQGLFLDDATFVVIDDHEGGTGVELWTLGADGVRQGGADARLRHRSQATGRPSLERSRGLLAFGAREGGGSNDHVVHVVDLRARPLVVQRTSAPLPGWPRGLQWSDGRCLAWCADGQAVLQLGPDATWQVVCKAQATVRVLCPIDDDRLVVGSGDDQRRAWVEQHGPGARPAWRAEAPEAPDRVAWSPAADRLAVGTEGGDVVLLPRPAEGLPGATAQLEGLPGVRLLDGGVVLSNLHAARPRAHAGRVVGLAFTSDGRRLVSAGGAPQRSAPPGSRSDLRVWEVASGAPVGEARALVGAGDDGGVLDLSPDGRHVLVGTTQERDRRGVEVWALDGPE